jgi:MSHA biogenesis protein MshI
MAFFRRTKKHDGWMAIVLQRDGIAAATVTRGLSARPTVSLAVFVPVATNAETLEKAGKDLKVSAYQCTTLLSAGQYQILSVDAPNVSADEVKTAVRWRLKDMLDFPVDEATIDVLDIPLDKDASVRPPNTMFVVAARNNLIAPRQQMFAAAKISLSVIDIPEMAQRNISSMLEAEGRGLALLSFDEDGGLLTVSYRGELYLTRRIDIALAQLLDSDHDRKHQSFDRITLELQRSLDNFERQFSFISISRLVLAPSTVSGLEEYLSSNLYTTVETLDLASLFDLERVPELTDKAVQQRFFLPVGAALRAVETQT